MKYIVVVISLLFSFSYVYSYSPTNELVEKTKQVVDKIELLIENDGEPIRVLILKHLDVYESKLKNNERSAYILRYIKEQLRESDVFDYSYVTPFQTQGPYYPVSKLEDIDNNLVYVGDGERAEGEVLYFAGRVGYLDGMLLDGGTVEIWQTDNRAVYLHSNDEGFANRDTNFQFYGESKINEYGEYSFTTIAPGEYDFRPAHIHIIVVDHNGERLHTTQIYFDGDLPQTNNLDGLDAGIQENFHMLVMRIKEHNNEYYGKHDIVLPN